MIFSQDNISSIIIEGKEYNIQSIPFIGNKDEWDTKSDYIPKAGELIIYTPDSKNTNYRFKIGDGTSKITNLVLNYIETAAEREGLINLINTISEQAEGNAENIQNIIEEIGVLKNKKLENIKKASGSVITLNDTDFLPLNGLNIYGNTTQLTTTGKNLFAVKEASNNGVSLAIGDDGCIILNGTATTDTIFRTDIGMTLPADTYYFSVSSLPPSGVALYLRKAGNVGIINITNTSKAGYTIESGEILRTDITVLSGTTLDSVKLYPMLERGTVRTTYEPYSGGLASPSLDWPQKLVSVGASDVINTFVTGKNLFAVAEASKSGISLTIGEDGCVVLNGTATADAVFRTNIGTTLPTDTYYFSVSALPPSGVALYLRKAGNVGIVNITNTSKAGYTIESGEILRTDITVLSGTTLNSVRLYPMLERGTARTEYEPYKEIQTLTASIVHEDENPSGLHGIPVSSGGNYTDENEQQRICDEIVFGQGPCAKRIGKLVMDGTNVKFTGKSSSNKSYVYTVRVLDLELSNYSERNANTILCSHGASISHTDAFNGAVGATAYKGEGSTLRYSFGLNADFDTIDKANAWLENQYNNNTPLTFLYVLSKPIETSLSVEELAIFTTLHTNKSSTIFYNDADAEFQISYYVPDALIPMKLGAGMSGKILAIDSHGCVIPTDPTQIARIESQLAYMAIMTGNEEMLEV